jgi:hypothetical protein
MLYAVVVLIWVMMWVMMWEVHQRQDELKPS